MALLIIQEGITLRMHLRALMKPSGDCLFVQTLMVVIVMGKLMFVPLSQASHLFLFHTFLLATTL